MSYEGRQQMLCAKGHYFVSHSCYEELVCPCGAETAWTNGIDDTNCESWGEIPQEIFDKYFLISSKIVEVCNLGHHHITSLAVYRVPSEEERKAARHSLSYNGDEFHPLDAKLFAKYFGN